MTGRNSQMINRISDIVGPGPVGTGRQPSSPIGAQSQSGAAHSIDASSFSHGGDVFTIEQIESDQLRAKVIAYTKVNLFDGVAEKTYIRLRLADPGYSFICFDIHKHTLENRVGAFGRSPSCSIRLICGVTRSRVWCSCHRHPDRYRAYVCYLQGSPPSR